MTGAEVTLSLTSRISLSLPTRRRGRNGVGLEVGALGRACSEVLTRHHRARDDALATLIPRASTTGPGQIKVLWSLPNRARALRSRVSVSSEPPWRRRKSIFEGERSSTRGAGERTDHLAMRAKIPEHSSRRNGHFACTLRPKSRRTLVSRAARRFDDIVSLR